MYQRFLDGVPIYLARHYWWAYLWKPATWFFDHYVIINAILFGQYKKLVNITISNIDLKPQGRFLQLSCVYGNLTPRTIESISPESLNVCDVSQIQLDLLKKKVFEQDSLIITLMNAENLGYKNDAFDFVMIFFLLHELPSSARYNSLSECVRVMAEGGNILITEYAMLPKDHYLYRFKVIRFILTKLEPFLAEFWCEDLFLLLNKSAEQWGKTVRQVSTQYVFGKFYRISKFTVHSIT